MRLLPRPRLIACGLTVAVAAALVSGSGIAANAAPTNTSAPNVMTGWTDSARPGVSYPATGQTDYPLGTHLDAHHKAHTSRVYATFDVSAFAGSQVTRATLAVREHGAADCTRRAIELWQTAVTTKAPSWRTAPAEQYRLGVETSTDFCPDAIIRFDVTATVAAAAAAHTSKITVELRVPAAHESDPRYGRQLSWFAGVELDAGHNTAPTVDPTSLYSGGYQCQTGAPGPALVGFPGLLQALGVDADPDDILTYDFAWWPASDPASRTDVSVPSFVAGQAVGTTVPAEALAEGASYGWQVRVSDGEDTSAWSPSCYFTVDRVAPGAPTVTSSNFPAGFKLGPVGEPARFTFSAGGDPDVAGFEWGWGSVLPTPGCTYSGPAGQLVCAPLFGDEHRVPVSSPGGTADVVLNPPQSGLTSLTVRSFDAAGNVSATVSYRINVPASQPSVTVVGTPQLNQTVTLAFAPAAGVTGVTSYTYQLNSGAEVSVEAAADGTATVTFLATEQSGYQVDVRSHSANGFVSAPGSVFVTLAG